jgi:hypothetical protein
MGSHVGCQALDWTMYRSETLIRQLDPLASQMTYVHSVSTSNSRSILDGLLVSWNTGTDVHETPPGTATILRPFPIGTLHLRLRPCRPKSL